jgi:hypothetical protein
MKHNYKTKKPRKTKGGHLEEGKPHGPTKGKKSSKITKRVRKAQNKSKILKSTLLLKSTPPNTPNASSPP